MDDLPINSIVQSTDPNTTTIVDQTVSSGVTNDYVQPLVQQNTGADFDLVAPSDSPSPAQTTLQIDLNNTLNKVNSLVSADVDPLQNQQPQQVTQSINTPSASYSTASKFGMAPQQELYSVAEVKPVDETTAEVFMQENVAEKEPVPEVITTEQAVVKDNNTDVDPLQQTGGAGTVVDLRTPVKPKQKIHTISDSASSVTLEADKEEKEFIDGILDNHAD